MEILIRKGSISVDGPIGFEVVDTIAQLNGLEYHDFAVVDVEDLNDSDTRYSIVEPLQCDLRIVLEKKKRKKVLGIF